MNKKAYCIISAAIFDLVAVMHLLRVINGWDFIIGPFSLPVICSYGGLVIAGGLSVWGFLSARE